MGDGGDTSFWGHLDIFRKSLIRCVVVISAVAVAVFCCKDFVFDSVILAPCRSDFVPYRLLCDLACSLDFPQLCPQMQTIEMINIHLASQLMTHISVSFYVALVVAFPYLVIELWLFVAPALYDRERSILVKGAFAFCFQFFLGVLISYFLIFPLTLNFLGTYQVSESVVNQIALNSYISTFIGMLFTMGLMFEMPVVAYFFSKIGVLSSRFLCRYRKVAVVIVLVAAAFITPSTDVFTMFLVASPLYLLYEMSVVIVKRVERKNK